MLFRAGLWLLLLACAGAYLSYNEANRVNFDKDTNYDDDGYDEPFKDLAMFKVINAVRKRSDELELLNFKTSGKDDSEGSRMERPLPEPKAKVKDVSVKPKTQKQSRWRIRRRPGLCLLKLCPIFSYIRQ